MIERFENWVYNKPQWVQQTWLFFKPVLLACLAIPGLVVVWFAIFGKIYKKNRRKND